MSRSRSTQGGALLALLAPIALGSCVADSVSMRITCALVPESDCTYTTGGLCFSRGDLNLEATDRYSAMLRVTNGLKPRARDVPPLSEPNGVQISELEIEIRDSTGKKPAFAKTLPNPYTVSASGFIKPSEDGLVGADLLPRAYVSAIRTLYMANALGSLSLSIIARGKTSGAVEVESGEWPWYINLRRQSIDPADGVCVKKDGDVCTLGQDGSSVTCNPALVDQTN